MARVVTPNLACEGFSCVFIKLEKCHKQGSDNEFLDGEKDL